MHVSLDTATDQLSEIWILPPYETPLYQLRMDVGDIHEVQIPTCSYRMGTPHMGYGLAYIGIQLNSFGMSTGNYMYVYVLQILKRKPSSSRFYGYRADFRNYVLMYLLLYWSLYLPLVLLFQAAV